MLEICVGVLRAYAPTILPVARDPTLVRGDGTQVEQIHDGGHTDEEEEAEGHPEKRQSRAGCQIPGDHRGEGHVGREALLSLAAHGRASNERQAVCAIGGLAGPAACREVRQRIR